MAGKNKYCCDASRLAYENYYMNQVGSGMPIYVGSQGQRGHGLGNVLGGLFRSAAPILKRGLKTAARSGLALVGDVLEGKNLKEAAKARAAQSIKQLVDEDEGVIRKRSPQDEEVLHTVQKRHKKRRKLGGKRRNRAGDIFD